MTRSGSFLVAWTDAHRAYLRTEARQAGWGVDVTEAAPGALARSVSWYQGDGTELALWCPEDCYIEEPMSLVRALASACREHGLELAEGEAAAEIGLAGGSAGTRVAEVRTAGRTFPAAVVVDAAGAWTRQVAQLARSRAGPADVAVALVRHQLLITEPAAGVDRGQPIVRVVDAAVYLRPALAGQLAVAEHRGGLFTMTPDGRFVAGPVPDAPGLWVASGCNGSGFSSSLALGEALAAWICDVPGRRDISALSPSRFGVMTDEELVTAGIWQYAHYYDAAAGARAGGRPLGARPCCGALVAVTRLD